MSLCIWTSLHLNLPAHRKEHLQKYRKAGWMIIGLLAPELVVWNAWEQRKEVKEISALMQKHLFMPKIQIHGLQRRGKEQRFCSHSKLKTSPSFRPAHGSNTALMLGQTFTAGFF